MDDKKPESKRRAKLLEMASVTHGLKYTTHMFEIARHLRRMPDITNEEVRFGPESLNVELDFLGKSYRIKITENRKGK